MLKSVLYCLLLVTTTARFADIIYLLVKEETNLPIPVFVVTTAMIIYGIVLLIKKIISNVTLKQFMAFFMIQTVMIVFNICYVAIASPLNVSVPETLIVGTFFDILINCGVIYLCTKQLRNHYFAVAQQPVASTNRHV